MPSFTNQLLFEGCKTIGPLFLLPVNKKTFQTGRKINFMKQEKNVGSSKIWVPSRKIRRIVVAFINQNWEVRTQNELVRLRKKIYGQAKYSITEQLLHRLNIS